MTQPKEQRVTVAIVDICSGPSEGEVTLVVANPDYDYAVSPETNERRGVPVQIGLVYDIDSAPPCEIGQVIELVRSA
jgi:hypothetical protein